MFDEYKYIFYKNLLVPGGAKDDLYKIIWDGDDITDIIFFPSAEIAKQWFRWDDAIDYAFETWEAIKNNKPDCRNFTEYMHMGHYPWSGNFADKNNNRVSADDIHTKDELYPAIPAEIRWYLVNFGIMTHDGVSQLRPLIAQWWG